MDYQKIYDSLIQNRILNRLSKCGDGSIESHHIIPKCMGGTNSSENIVNLYCKEHYIAHLLLAKIHKDSKFFEPLLFAVHCMSKSNNNTKRLFIPSNIFMKQRIEAAKRIQKITSQKRAIKITWDGQTHTFKEWSIITGIPAKTLSHRYHDGWDVQKIFTTKSKSQIILEFNGESHTLVEWAKKINLSRENLYNRIVYLGWSIERALTTPFINSQEKHQKKKYLYKGQYYSLFELGKKFKISPSILESRMRLYNMTLEEALRKPIKTKKIQIEYNGIKYKSVRMMLKQLHIHNSTYYKCKEKCSTIEEAITLALSITKQSS